MDTCEQNTLDKLDERRKAKDDVNHTQIRQQKKQAQQTYAEVHKQVRAHVRTDQRQYMDELAAQREEAACKRNIKELYDVVRKISGTYQQCTKPIRDRHGTLLTTHDAQLKRWK